MGTFVGGLLMEAGCSLVLPAGRHAATSAFLYRCSAVLLSIAQKNRHYFLMRNDETATMAVAACTYLNRNKGAEKLHCRQKSKMCLYVRVKVFYKAEKVEIS